jgi:hypothetical protein
VCDFTAYTDKSLYLINKPNATLTTSETPFFCHSHLVMKINVGAPDPTASAPRLDAFNPERLTGPLPQDILEVDAFLLGHTAMWHWGWPHKPLHMLQTFKRITSSMTELHISFKHFDAAHAAIPATCAQWRV